MCIYRRPNQVQVLQIIIKHAYHTTSTNLKRMRRRQKPGNTSKLNRLRFSLLLFSRDFISSLPSTQSNRCQLSGCHEIIQRDSHIPNNSDQFSIKIPLAIATHITITPNVCLYYTRRTNSNR